MHLCNNEHIVPHLETDSGMPLIVSIAAHLSVAYSESC